MITRELYSLFLPLVKGKHGCFSQCNQVDLSNNVSAFQTDVEDKIV